LIAGVNLSYDEAFETRFSADVEYRFGGPNKTIDKKKVAELPVIKALSSSPNHRDVRVHDKLFPLLNIETLPNLFECMDAAESAEDVAELGGGDGNQKRFEKSLEGFDIEDDGNSGIMRRSKTSSTFEAVFIDPDPSSKYSGKALIKCSYDSKSNKTNYAFYKYNGGGIPKKLDDNDLIFNIPLNPDNREMLEKQSFNILDMPCGGISVGIPKVEKDGSITYVYKTVIPGRCR
jgi:hypothetical protein